MKDLHKPEDRHFVAEANNLEDEWDAIEQDYASTVSSDGLLYNFYLLLSQNRIKNKLYIAPCEGMHQTTAATHIMMNSSVDLLTGKMKKNSLNIMKSSIWSRLIRRASRKSGELKLPISGILFFGI